MRKILSCLAVGLLSVTGMQAQGLHFEQHKTWDQVLAQAKKEHKYVFVNCCMQGGKPCEEMDNSVYPVKAVGDYYNVHYISLTLNMEVLPVDETSRAEKALADTLRKRYGVNGYPNLLFLDANGKLLHRHLGALTPKDFLTLGHDALDPNKQYYAQAAAFNAGKRDTAILRQLAFDAFNFGDTRLAREAAHAYLAGKTNIRLANLMDMSLIGFVLQDQAKSDTLAHLYVKGLSLQEKLKPENLRILISIYDQPDTLAHYMHLFLQQPDSVLLQASSMSNMVQAAYKQGLEGESYQYLWTHHLQADSVYNMPLSMLKLFSRSISKNIIMPFMNQAGYHPDWQSLRQAIIAKYDDVYADRTLLQTQMAWYGGHGQWTECINAVVDIDKKYGADRKGYEINSELARPVLAHSTDTAVLQYVLERMQQVVMAQSPSLSDINTYAFLLYNTGRREEAIHWEKIALSAEPGDKELSANLEKMNNGTFSTIQP